MKPVSLVVVLFLASVAGLAGCSTTQAPAPRPSAEPPRAPQTTPAPPSTKPAAPSTTPRRGGYYQDDGPGDSPPPNLEQTPDAVPRDEVPLRSGANRPYVVFGKTYSPQINDRPFVQRGIGSWYGRKFHGQKTSSGEPYNMYAMTAAHPTLPIPSYVRVTHAGNGRSVVVRVNDRGPFHSDRIIDLSYTAALKLGYVNQGSAMVEVERVFQGSNAAPQVARAPVSSMPSSTPVTTPPSPSGAAPRSPPSGPLGGVAGGVQGGAAASTPSSASGSSAPSSSSVSSAPVAVAPVTLPAVVQPDGVYLQLAAFGAREGAEEFRIKTYQQLPDLTETIFIVTQNNLHRLHLGPYKDRAAAQAAADKLRDALQMKPVFVVK